MPDTDTNRWKPAELNALMAAVVDAVESGEIDSAFDNADLTAGNIARTKNTRNFTKNYLAACLRAGIEGISEANADTALGLVNAFRQMNAERPLDILPKNYKVFAIRLPREDGNPDIEVYIKEGHKVLYGEKILPRGILTENFLNITGSSLF